MIRALVVYGACCSYVKSWFFNVVFKNKSLMCQGLYKINHLLLLTSSEGHFQKVSKTQEVANYLLITQQMKNCKQQHFN